MKKRRVVLLGSAGTGTAFAAACALRRVWSQSVKLVAMDVNPSHLVTTSLLADCFEQVPFSSAPEFPEVLHSVIGRHEVTTYLPLLPDEISLTARLREEGAILPTITVMTPPLETSAACADKWLLGRMLNACGVPFPKSAQASVPFEADSFFLKPKDGVGSRGVAKVNKDDLSSVLGESAEDWIVQEICLPPEITVDVFYDPENDFIRVVCRERIETKSGVSTKARLFEDDELSRFARTIAVGLKLKGSFCFQVMRNSHGWVVTDVNPRPGAATAMCALTGNDFFAATFAYHWGEDARVFFRPLNGEQFVTRQYSEFLMGTKV